MSFTIFWNEKTPFQTIKTRSLKNRKIDIFSKGLTHGFCLKMALFSTFIFYVIQARKMSFAIFQNNKTPFQAIKTRSSKNRKIDIFPNRLTHGFGLKMALFPIFFFRQYWLGQCLLRYSTSKKTPLQPIKTKSSKSQKTDIFPKGLAHSFGPKLAIFPTFFFREYKPEKCLLRYSRTRKGLSRL